MMEKEVKHPVFTESVFVGEHTWLKLYHSLRSPVTSYVYTSNLPAWRGQEQDLVEEIIQETIVRLFAYVRLVERGLAPPISCPEAFCHTIARNYCHDLRRKEVRLTRFPTDAQEWDATMYLADGADPLEDALDEMMGTYVITASVRAIAAFPEKQRTALLVNLAHYTDFDSEPSLLQTALLRVGICLSDYRRPALTDPVERGRHNTLVSIAYKRLKTLFNTPSYSIVA